jgi:hypothetical protein
MAKGFIDAAADEFWRRYREAGMPYGETVGGLERWLGEQRCAFGLAINAWRPIKAKMANPMEPR